MKCFHCENNAPLSAAQCVTAAYLFLFTLIQPVVVHRAYFDITETKQACFVLLSVAYILCVCCVRALSCITKRRLPDFRGMLRARSASDACMLAFAGIFLISALLSPFPCAFISGADNRYQGLLTISLYAALWFCLSRNFGVHPCNAYALVAGFCAVSVIACLQAFGLDPFALRAGLAAADRPRYLSTLGNVNFYSAYLAALLPFVLVQWSLARGHRRFLYGFALVCGAAGALFTGSDSFLLAFFAMLLLAPLILANRPGALRRYLGGVVLLLFVMQIVFRLYCAAPARELYVSLLLRALLHPPVWAGLVCAFCALWYALIRMPGDLPAGFRGAYARSLGALVLLAAAFVLLVNTVLADVSLGAADRYLKLGASWGTDRGRVWAFCIERFCAFAPLQKIIGGGPGCLVYLDAARNVFADASIDSAHNEFLHYLLTVGVAGLCSYLGLLVSSCVSAARRLAKDPLACALMLSMLCYLAQSTVNIAQPVSTPYLFLCLGLLRGSTNGAQPRWISDTSCETAVLPE